MPIGNPELEKVAASAIVPALVASGLDPKRVDKHNAGGLLKAEIIGFIECAEIIVADLTLERPNCYLEIGYAMGLDKLKNLILTVREDHFLDSKNHKRGGPKIHFDLAGYDILRWHPDYIDEFRNELEKRIKRRLAITAPASTAESTPVHDDWFAEQVAASDVGMQSTSRTGYMDLHFVLSGTERFTLPVLREAARNAPIHTFGWPIAVFLDKAAWDRIRELTESSQKSSDRDEAPTTIGPHVEMGNSIGAVRCTRTIGPRPRSSSTLGSFALRKPYSTVAVFTRPLGWTVSALSQLPYVT